jgi:hypothetical protein
VGLFEAIDTSRVVMVAHVNDTLSLYNLLDKLITYVKGEGDNLCTLTQALTSVVNCGLLGLIVPWKGLCFGCASTKTCQCACNDIKVFVGFREVSLKVT